MSDADAKVDALVTLAEQRAAAVAALRKIARGKLQIVGGQPLPREDARQLARRALVELGEDW